MYPTHKANTAFNFINFPLNRVNPVTFVQVITYVPACFPQSFFYSFSAQAVSIALQLHSENFLRLTMKTGRRPHSMWVKTAFSVINMCIQNNVICPHVLIPVKLFPPLPPQCMSSWDIHFSFLEGKKRITSCRLRKICAFLSLLLWCRSMHAHIDNLSPIFWQKTVPKRISSTYSRFAIHIFCQFIKLRILSLEGLILGLQSFI